MNPIEAHMKYCSRGFGNLISHISDHDGTRRSAQACYIIEKHNPQNAKDLAKIIHDNNLEGTRIGWEMPIFWKDKELVDFCELGSQKSGVTGTFYWSGKPPHGYSEEEYEKVNPGGMEEIRERHEWYMNRCVAHADNVDLCADIWELSPTVKENYPSTEKMFMGTDIGAGWHDFKREVEKELYKIDRA